MCAFFLFVFLLWPFQNCFQPGYDPGKDQASVLSAQCLNFSEHKSSYTQVRLMRQFYKLWRSYYTKYVKMCTKLREICVLQTLNSLITKMWPRRILPPQKGNGVLPVTACSRCVGCGLCLRATGGSLC